MDNSSSGEDSIDLRLSCTFSSVDSICSGSYLEDDA